MTNYISADGKPTFTTTPKPPQLMLEATMKFVDVGKNWNLPAPNTEDYTKFQAKISRGLRNTDLKLVPGFVDVSVINFYRWVEIMQCNNGGQRSLTCYGFPCAQIFWVDLTQLVYCVFSSVLLASTCLESCNANVISRPQYARHTNVPKTNSNSEAKC